MQESCNYRKSLVFAGVRAYPFRMSRPHPEYELLAGPLDGEHRTVPDGQRDFACRIDGVWHIYSLRATDLGMMLEYQGATLRLRAADPAS